MQLVHAHLRGVAARFFLFGSLSSLFSSLFSLLSPLSSRGGRREEGAGRRKSRSEHTHVGEYARSRSEHTHTHPTHTPHAERAFHRRATPRRNRPRRPASVLAWSAIASAKERPRRSAPAPSSRARRRPLLLLPPVVVRRPPLTTTTTEASAAPRPERFLRFRLVRLGPEWTSRGLRTPRAARSRLGRGPPPPARRT